MGTVSTELDILFTLWQILFFFLMYAVSLAFCNLNTYLQQTNSSSTSDSSRNFNKERKYRRANLLTIRNGHTKS